MIASIKLANGVALFTDLSGDITSIWLNIFLIWYGNSKCTNTDLQHAIDTTTVNLKKKKIGHDMFGSHYYLQKYACAEIWTYFEVCTSLTKGRKNRNKNRRKNNKWQRKRKNSKRSHSSRLLSWVLNWSCSKEKLGTG